MMRSTSGQDPGQAAPHGAHCAVLPQNICCTLALFTTPGAVAKHSTATRRSRAPFVSRTQCRQ
eukprot:6796505-Prymnesium_polylepis.1